MEPRSMWAHVWTPYSDVQITFKAYVGRFQSMNDAEIVRAVTAWAAQAHKLGLRLKAIHG